MTLYQSTSFSRSLSDLRIERSIRDKRLSSESLIQDIDDNKQQIFEHFLIAGIPKISSPNPEIFFLYPSHPLSLTETAFQQCLKFCYPNQALKIAVRRRTHPFLDLFVFEMTVNKQPLYGVCLHFILNPTKFPDFSKIDPSFPVCFCFLSYRPIFSAHFQFLGHLVYQPMDSSYIQDYTADSILVEKKVENEILSGEGFSVFDSLTSQLAFYYKLSVNHSQDQVFKLNLKTQLVIPQKLYDDKYLAYACLDVLFSLLSAQSIVRLYLSLILEHCVIFLSPSLHFLTMCIFASKVLLSPFNVRMRFMPILPNHKEFLDLLDLPIPFCYGLLDSTPLRKRTLPENLCIVNLNNSHVEDKTLNSVFLPQEDVLINLLNLIIRDNRNFIFCPTK
jgi:hypothetical protein